MPRSLPERGAGALLVAGLLLVVATAWTLDGGRFELAVEVPPNTTATVRLPLARLADVTEAGESLATGNGITAQRQDGEAVVVDVGSGQYSFAYPMGQ